MGCSKSFSSASVYGKVLMTAEKKHKKKIITPKTIKPSKPKSSTIPICETRQIPNTICWLTNVKRAQCELSAGCYHLGHPPEVHHQQQLGTDPGAACGSRRELLSTGINCTAWVVLFSLGSSWPTYSLTEQYVLQGPTTTTTPTWLRSPFVRKHKLRFVEN